MTRLSVLCCAGLALALAACKTRKEVPVDTTESSEIPREVALERLGHLLPTAEYVNCSQPKHSFKQGEIKGLFVKPDRVEINFGKDHKLSLIYDEIASVNLELVGKYYTARVFTTVQVDKDKEHFGFLWRMDDPARRAVELLSALMKRK